MTKVRGWLANVFFRAYLWARGMSYDDYVVEVYNSVERSLLERKVGID